MGRYPPARRWRAWLSAKQAEDAPLALRIASSGACPALLDTLSSLECTEAMLAPIFRGFPLKEEEADGAAAWRGVARANALHETCRPVHCRYRCLSCGFVCRRAHVNCHLRFEARADLVKLLKSKLGLRVVHVHDFVRRLHRLNSRWQLLEMECVGNGGSGAGEQRLRDQLRDIPVDLPGRGGA